MEIYEQLVEQIKALRRQHGMRQKQLAEKIGVDVSVISKFERGVGRLPVERIEQMLNVFDYTLQPAEKKNRLPSSLTGMN
jgi:transcriptional regulator with XRE-family HTH domain